MLTDDTGIDRRILQEAVTLIDDGHQVIVIGRADEVHPAHEIIDGVRIERIVDQAVGRPVLFGSKLVQILTNAINAGSAANQRAMGRVIGWMFRVLRRVIRGWFALGTGDLGESARAAERHRSTLVATERAQERVGGVLVRVVAKGWWLVGMLNHRIGRPVITWATSAYSTRSALPPRDAYLSQRAAYYRPDVVHAHDLPQLRAGLAAARMCKVPLVYDMHELYPEIGTLTEAQQRSLGELENDLIRDCSATITVNPYISREIAKRYVVPEPQVILNAIDPYGDDVVADRRFHNKLGLDDSDRVLLFQGWMSETRGLDLLIEAVALTSPSVHLVLMGYGDIKGHLAALAEERSIDHRVHIMDAVPQAELLGWTRAADAGVIPYPAIDLNHHLCSPNKLFEFIQSGLPIVANDLPFLRDVVVGESIGYVAKIEDEDAFASAIDDVLGLGPSVPEIDFGVNLRRAAPRYSWASQEPVLRAIYRDIVSEPVGAERRNQ